jgi:hypothetical protein
MPAAIRIDIHLGSIQASDQNSKAVKPDVKELTAIIADAVRHALLEFAQANYEEAESDNSLNSTIHPGLGPVWPPETQMEPNGLDEGISEYLENLMAGEDTRTLMPTKAYDNGAYHVYFMCDHG